MNDKICKNCIHWMCQSKYLEWGAGICTQVAPACFDDYPSRTDSKRLVDSRFSADRCQFFAEKVDTETERG